MLKTTELSGEAWLNHPLRRSRDLLLVGASCPLSLSLVTGALILSRLKIGPHPLFTQERIGRDGKPFTMYKVQTMPAGQAQTPSEGTIDSRAGDVGNGLRLAAFDELPQLLNVLKGDMSIIGPRALLADEIDRMKTMLSPALFNEWYEAYITFGPGCVSSYVNASHGQPRSSFVELAMTRAQLDIEDARQASPARDNQILAATATMLIGTIARSGTVMQELR